MVKRCYFYSHFSDHPSHKGITYRSLGTWLLYSSAGWAADGPRHQPSCAYSLVTHHCKWRCWPQMLWSSWKLSHYIAPNQAPSPFTRLSAHGSILRPGSLGFQKLFRDSHTDKRPHFDVSGRWLFQGSVFSNPTTFLPPHHHETGQLSQIAFVKPYSLCPWPWFPNSFFQRKPGACFS